MSNPISIVGTIATDPRRFVTQSGVTLCSFRVASGERRYDRTHNKWVDGETNWFGVTAFRGLAEHALSSFQKGERVIVQGRLRVRNWEKDGKSGVSVEVEAEALGHDLRWGVSRFEKRSPEASDDAGAAAERGMTSEFAALDTASAPGDEPAPEASIAANRASGMSADGFLPTAA